MLIFSLRLVLFSFFVCLVLCASLAARFLNLSLSIPCAWKVHHCRHWLHNLVSEWRCRRHAPDDDQCLEHGQLQCGLHSVAGVSIANHFDGNDQAETIDRRSAFQCQHWLFQPHDFGLPEGVYACNHGQEARVTAVSCLCQLQGQQVVGELRCEGCCSGTMPSLQCIWHDRVRPRCQTRGGSPSWTVSRISFRWHFFLRCYFKEFKT